MGDFSSDQASGLRVEERHLQRQLLGVPEIVVVEANPESYTELKRQKVIDGKVWSYPTLAYDHLFARSTKEGVCLEIK